MKNINRKSNALFTSWRIGSVEIKNRTVMRSRINSQIGAFLNCHKDEMKITVKFNGVVEAE